MENQAQFTENVVREHGYLFHRNLLIPQTVSKLHMAAFYGMSLKAFRQKLAIKGIRTFTVASYRPFLYDRAWRPEHTEVLFDELGSIHIDQVREAFKNMAEYERGRELHLQPIHYPTQTTYLYTQRNGGIHRRLQTGY